MSFQPPPPPPGNPPPPPPPGYGGPARPGPGGVDPKTVNVLDWAILGAGALIFIFSFVDFYGSADVTYMGRTETFDGGSASAWHEVFGGGFFAWFAMLFGVVGAVVIALSLFAPTVKLPVVARVGATILFLAGAVFEIIAIFVTPGVDDVPSGYDVSINHGFGFWASLVLLIAGSVLCVMRAQQTNTALPGPLSNIPRIGA